MRLGMVKRMDYRKYIIYWNRHDFYNYGSQVAFHHNSVSFKNELMSPGKKIVGGELPIIIKYHVHIHNYLYYVKVKPIMWL